MLCNSMQYSSTIFQARGKRCAKSDFLTQETDSVKEQFVAPYTIELYIT